jgi:hypothetical protein
VGVEIVQVHLFFLASRLWVRRVFGRLHIPVLLHRGVSGLVVLQLWSRDDVLLTLPSNGPACFSEVRCF